MWERMAAPVCGLHTCANEGGEGVLSASGTTNTVSAVRVTLVVSGDWGVRIMVPSTTAGEAEL